MYKQRRLLVFAYKSKTNIDFETLFVKKSCRISVKGVGISGGSTFADVWGSVQGGRGPGDGEPFTNDRHCFSSSNEISRRLVPAGHGFGLKTKGVGDPSLVPRVTAFFAEFMFQPSRSRETLSSDQVTRTCLVLSRVFTYSLPGVRVILDRPFQYIQVRKTSSSKPLNPWKKSK